MSLRIFFPLVLLCAIVATVFFSPGLSGTFVFDDTPNIVTNGAVHVTTLDLESLLHAAYSFQPGGGSRSLAMLSFGFDHWRGGLDPKVFKATNIFIHALTTVVLALLLQSILQAAAWPTKRASIVAFVVALLWAVHPIQVSSVLYVVQRMQTLVTLFLLLALFFYLKARLAQIDGQRSRTNFLLSLFFWALAFACKEDAVLLPAFTLALELTVLNFRASSASVEARLRTVYWLAMLAGAATFLLYLLPRHWHWEAYPGRDFSTTERLLTQGRVLMMYLGQILLPLPGNLTFYYDDIVVSRGVMQPWTTLPALIGVLLLMLLGWIIRRRFPVISFGIFIFFSGHFVTSNVIGLELAFEHRNQIPLIGVLLVVCELLRLVVIRLNLSRKWLLVGFVIVLIAYSALTFLRSSTWGKPLEFAQAGVIHAPTSVRARILLCNTYFEMSRGDPVSPYLQQAIETCQVGGELLQSATLLGNVVIFKTIQGTITEDDWKRFLDALKTAVMSVENKRLAWIMVNNTMRNIALNEVHVRETLRMIVLDHGAPFRVSELINFGYFFLGYTTQPEEAYRYFEKAVSAAQAEEPDLIEMLANLEYDGYEGWAEMLRDLAYEQGKLERPQ